MTTTRSTPSTEAAKAQERRTATQVVLAHLIAERAETLTLYCRVAGLEPYNTNHSNTDLSKQQPAQKLLQEFCQLLVDYIAAGHFGLYERLINGTERRRELKELAEQLYPRIAETTEHALDFNDKYDCHCEITDSFHDDLSRLGEEIAARIELEDKLIAALTR
jgi:regulator of sigma D